MLIGLKFFGLCNIFAAHVHMTNRLSLLPLTPAESSQESSKISVYCTCLLACTQGPAKVYLLFGSTSPTAANMSQVIQFQCDPEAPSPSQVQALLC